MLRGSSTSRLYMPLSALRLTRFRQCPNPLRCDSALSPSLYGHLPANPLASQQRRILETSTSYARTDTNARPAPSLRSPFQWSHIIHRIRKPLGATSTGMAVQHRSHGHSHGHHHHHDNTYLVSANKSDPGVRITRIGLYVNLGMALAKGAGGYVFNSQALTADALHAFTDLVRSFRDVLCFQCLR